MNQFRVLFLFLSILLTSLSIAQTNNTDTSKVKKMYKIEKNDGTIYVGNIISQDAREILLETTNIGQLFIPKHEIKSITEIKQGDIDNSGEFKTEEIFATRYFITTNGLPIVKGDSYILWNLFGPDFQFGVAPNLGIGIMTSWIGMPLVGTIKFSHQLGDKVSFGAGSLIGTGSWMKPDFFAALPFASLTFGDRRSNINFSAGYGFLTYKQEVGYYDTTSYNYYTRTETVSEGRLLLSIAGMVKVGKKVSLVLDTFIAPLLGNNNFGFSLILPGLRFQTDPNKAFQFGFGGIVSNDGSGAEVQPFPIPMVSWFRKL